MAISTNPRETLFKKIYEGVSKKIKNCDSFFENIITNKGNTQNSERITIQFIKDYLDENNMTYEEAGSQCSKDFRNISNIGLDIEIKKCDNRTIIFNDTCPNSDIWYIIFYTSKKRKNDVPHLFGINGYYFIYEDQWVNEYHKDINIIKQKYCLKKSEINKKRMKAYVRPNYSADLTDFIENDYERIFKQSY